MIPAPMRTAVRGIDRPPPNAGSEIAGRVAARVAAAVGLFTKANPTTAFGKLGPLTAR